ncbi:type II secretion system F family protein [Clostridium sp. Mt-5]|uniref:Type II secretion system F family protein n=1 Tax=Clostridium moutaii TaxID=3240932 RepID=A0ABV4BQG3_9CLOT
MKKFIYKVWNDKLNIISGQIEEENMDTVFQNLKNKDLKIIYVREKFTLSKFRFFQKKLKDERLADFCGQIAMILSSGVSLLTGFEIIGQHTKNKSMRNMIFKLEESIKKGNNLSSAMKSCEEFPALLTDMVATGEISGNVDTVLYNMEDFYKKEANIKNKIKSASIYPLLVLIVALGMLLFFNFMVFPELKDLFANANLPFITIFVLGIMNFFNDNFVSIIAFVVVFIIILKYINTIPGVSYFIGKTILKVPILGDFKLDVMTSRFTRSMGLFLKSAIPIITIMNNIKLVLNNEFAAQKIENVKRQLVNGAKFADSIQNQNIFHPLVTEMMKVGEETGKLDAIMFKLADIYDEKVETEIRRLSALVEPALILVIGLIVGVIILGMALPVMQMSQGVK